MALNFRQLQAFVAVFEEGSFSRAALRENATQSGLSMLVSNLEARIGLPVFERTSKGVKPTQVGERLYRKAAAMMRMMGEAEAELAALAGEASGKVHIGLIPAFTYSLVAPALADFIARYPNVDVTVTEAYSPVLSAAVARGDFDFAIVPSNGEGRGIRSSFFGRDREFLVSGGSSALRHLEPVRMSRLSPLKLILPTHGNARRERLEAVFASAGIEISAVLEMDAMLAALELVGQTDWMTIVPATIVSSDLRGKIRKLSPLVKPDLTVDYVLIEPKGRTLSVPARLFAETLGQSFGRLQARLGKTLKLPP